MQTVKNQLIEKIKKNQFDLTKATPEEKTALKTLIKQTRSEALVRNEQLIQAAITVKQLFQSIRFYDLMPYLEKYTEMDEETTTQYKGIFERVKKQKEQAVKRFLLMDATGDETPDVYAMAYDKGIRYAISFVSYEELANYKVHPFTLETYPKEEIAAGFLEEFSWFAEDEVKEEIKEEVEVKIEEIEKNEAIEKAEEEGTISIFSKSIDKEEWDESSEKIHLEEETIRQYAQVVSFEKIKTALQEQYEYFEEAMGVEKEEALHIIKNHFFAVRKQINETPRQRTGDRIRFNQTSHLIELTREDKKVKCLYSGESALEVIDQVINTRSIFAVKTKEANYLLFIIAYLREALVNREVEKESLEEEVGYLRKTQETARIVEKAKTGLNQLTTKELLRFSYVIEAIEMDY